MKNTKIILFLSLLCLASCDPASKNYLTTKKIPDEYNVEKKNPLIIPPNFSLVPPEEQQKKDANKTELKHLSESDKNFMKKVKTSSQRQGHAAKN